MPPRDWDAATYDRIGSPQARWGLAVLERLELSGDERVLDAGCGTGRVTEALRDRLPKGRVIALDASPSMLVETRARLGGDRIEYVEADLGRPLPHAVGVVDAVFSTATFHWIRDHHTLFANLAAVMRPGARLVAQCGGRGNLDSVLDALRLGGDAGEYPAHFAGAEETARCLGACGFVEVRTWLHDEFVTFDSDEELSDFLATVVLGHHLEHLAPEQRSDFIQEVVDRLPSRAVDCVRLNIVARRS